MAEDDTVRHYADMASNIQGVYKHPHPSGAEAAAQDPRLPAQQQAPVRPSRSRGQVSRREGGCVVPVPAGSRGPRSLYLRRDADTFGFTLRHFIVYPPDSITASDGRHAAVGALREPMETIFVKQVYENSAAHRAGLHHGDRLVSVNGVSLNGKTYAQVVQLIQHSPPYLHLLVVPKEDDVLQKYFPETAHNPETNQRPKRFASPDTLIPRRQSAGESLKYRPIVPQPLQGPQQPQPQVVPRSRPRTVDSVSWVGCEEAAGTQRCSLYAPASAAVRVPVREGRSSEQLVRTGGVERPRAQPQAPRAMGRRASEGSNLAEYPDCSGEMLLNTPLNLRGAPKAPFGAPPSDTHSYSSAESVPCGLAACRRSLDAARRQSSASLTSSLADGSKDSLSSYDSTSTLTGQDTDDSVIMTRFRKSFEKKEEFLKGPNQPISWKPPEDCGRIIPTVIQREFYGRPQKLQKEWPPNEPNLNGQESPSKTSAAKPTHQNFQRVKSDIDSERDYLIAQNGKDLARNDFQAARSKLYESTGTQTAQFMVGGLVSNVAPLQRNSGIRQSKDKNSFVTTLSRIHESTAPSLEVSDDSSILLNGAVSQDNSLQPESLSSLDERRYPVPPDLKIVSRRTKQFESGRPLPEDEDGSLNDRTNFYRSELSRLSSKRVVPNVAVRKREFETLEIENNKDYRRDKDSVRRPTQRESRSLDNSDVPFENESPHVQLRVRSNSAESWTAAMQSSGTRNNLDWHLTSVGSDEKQRNKVVRQDSYISALKSKVPDEDHSKQSVYVEAAEEMDIGPQTGATVVPSSTMPAAPLPPSPRAPGPVVAAASARAATVPRSVAPTTSNITATTISTTTTITTTNIITKTIGTTTTTITGPTVATRPTQLSIASPMRPATSLHPADSPHYGDVSATRLSASPVPGDVPPQVVRRSKNNTNSIGEEDRVTRRVSYLKATWGDRMHVESDLDLSDTEISPQALRSRSGSAEGSGPLSLGRSETPTSPDREQAPITREGALSCKFMELEGKRANDRSWHKVWAVLKGPHLFLYKDRHHHHQSPMGLVETEQQLPGGVDMRYSAVNVADDYTKRKNVLRISAPYPYGTELLLQADSPVEMAEWIRTLQEQTGAEEEPRPACVSENKQAVPQQVPAATSVQVQGSARLSPQPSNKSKLSALRNRSPTGQSPKSKTWRGRVVKQFKKLNQGGSGSPSSPTTPDKLTFGVPLEHCQRSVQSEFIPRFVEMCTEIIEERGLDVIGIYRVPGNNAAVSALTDELNKGVHLALQDVRASDTNVVSSLLKSFFRKLPDSLLTSELYPHFIEADKIEDPKARLLEIKRLLSDLPYHQYATLKHLILHLKKVVDNSEINKMEARNLAIVFGPTLVRNVEDNNMVTMVTDMSHQCRIVESLLLYAEWFFSEDETEALNINTNIAQDVASVEMDNTSATVNNTLLLGNISKIEGIKTETREKKDIVSSIINAANRKIQKKSRKLAVDQTSNTKEEVTTPTSESKDTSIVPLLSQPDEPKQISLDSEESSSSDNTVPEHPSLMTYPQLEAKTSERIEKFKQETMAMLQQKRRSETNRTYMKPYFQNGDQTDSSDTHTSSDLLATITLEFDNKIKALQSPTNCLTVEDNIPYADESPDVTLNSFDTTIVEGARMFKESQKCDQDLDKMSPKSFRNPSLHKTFTTVTSKPCTDLKYSRKNNSYEPDAKEKDVDEQENSSTKSQSDNEQRNADELNELCKNSFNTFIINKELKCSASDSKLKRSESLNKSDNKDCEVEHGKLKRSVSLNRAADRLKRSDSLTKYEKTESNINLRRELVDDTNRRLKKVSTKLKRKNGMPERSIKRRHTVGGTKDFDRIPWLDNRLRDAAEEASAEDKEKIVMRSSSPDLSSADKLIVTATEDSKLPLESHI